MDIIKNPVLIAFFASYGTYIYLKNDSNQKKDQKSVKKSKINMYIPMIVFIAVLILSMMYFNNNVDIFNMKQQLYDSEIDINIDMPKNFKQNAFDSYYELN